MEKYKWPYKGGTFLLQNYNSLPFEFPSNLAHTRTRD